MEEIRRPCDHRGTSDVLTSSIETDQGAIEFCICRQCRRFWLERNGWLLSRREAVLVLRSWPGSETLAGLAR